MRKMACRLLLILNIVAIIVGTIPFGNRTASAGAAPTGALSVYQKAYIPNYNKGTLDVMDLVTGTVETGKIKVGDCPTSAAVNPNGTQVFVTNNSDLTVSVVHPQMDEVIATIRVGSPPRSVAFNKDGSKAYVATDSGVTVIDTAALKALKSIHISNALSQVSVGSYIYVGTYGGTVSMIDTTTDEALSTTIRAGSNITGMSVNPAGTKVYTANQDDWSVSVIDVATQKLEKNIAVGAFPDQTKKPGNVEVSPDGNRVYVTVSGSSQIQVIDAATNNIIDFLPAFSPQAIGMSADGNSLYSVNDSSVSIIDLKTKSRKDIGIYTGHKITGTFMATSAMLANASYYTVSFDSQAGSPVEPVNLIQGSRIELPAAPTREGYTFAGWFKDQQLQNKWHFATDMVTSDRTLYAKWAINSESKPLSYRKAYIPSTAVSGSNYYVDVFDLNTSTVQKARIKVGKKPVSVGYHPNGSQVLIANQGDNSVSVIDPNDDTVKKTITINGAPAGIAYKADGSKAYVATIRGISIIDTVTLTVIKESDYAGYYRNVAVVGNKVYLSGVQNNLGYYIDVYDTVEDSWRRSFRDSGSLFDSPSQIVANSAGTKLYFASGNGSILVFDVAKGRIEARIPTTTAVAAEISADGRELYAAEIGINNGKIGVYSTARPYNLIRTIDLAKQPSAIGLLADGSFAYILNASNSFSIVDLQAGSEVSRVGLSSGAAAIGSFMVQVATVTYASGLTASFDSQYGSAVPYITGIGSGSRIEAPSAPVRAGFTFGGWYKDLSYAGPWQFDADTVNADITLYAKWIPNKPTSEDDYRAVLHKIYLPLISGFVDVFDMDTNVMQQELIPVGKSSVGVAISPTGEQVLVVDSAYGIITAIDPITNAVVAVVPVGSNATSVVYSSDGRKAYVGASQEVRVINTSTLTVEKTIPIDNENPASLLTVGDTLYVGTLMGVYTVDTVSDRLEGKLRNGGASSIAVNASGTKLYFANMSKSFEIYDLATKQSKSYNTNTSGPWTTMSASIDVSSDEKYVLYNEDANGSPNLYLFEKSDVNYDYGTKRVSTNGTRVVNYSDDNNQAYALSYDSLYVIDVKKQTVLAQVKLNDRISGNMHFIQGRFLAPKSASMKPKGFTVSFDAMEGSAVDPIKNITAGSKVSGPAEPTRAGYAFAGWFKDKAYANRWDFAQDKVDSNLTLYAKWDKQPPAPVFNPAPKPEPGKDPGTTGIPNTEPTGPNHLRVKVSSTMIATPSVGDDAPSGNGVINPYTKGNDIPGVDSKVNRYIGLYEVNPAGKVVKFSLIVLKDGDWKPYPAPKPAPGFDPVPEPEPGHNPGTTSLPDGKPGAGNHFLAKVSAHVIETPNVGDDAPTGLGVTDPYHSGDDISGVDAKGNRYIGLYEIDSKGKVVKFRLYILNDKDVNPVPQPTPAPGFDPTPRPHPGKQPDTTGVPGVKPEAGNHLRVKVSASIIATPNVGDAAPSGNGIINPYQADADIPGVDAKVNRFIGIYEVTAQGKVVKFTLIVLNDKDITSDEVPAPGFDPIPEPAPGPVPGRPGIPNVTKEENNHLLVKVSSKVIATPNVGDAAPSGEGIIDPYTPGADIKGADPKINRYIGLYEVNAQGKVVKFRLIVLNDEDVNEPNPVPSFTPKPDPVPGTKPGTTDLPGATSEEGNHLIVKVSSKIIDTPNVGDAAPTTGVIDPYQAVDDIPGADAKVNRYIGIYEVNAQGKVVKFSLIVLNDEDVIDPILVPGFTPTPKPQPGTDPGTTGIPVVQPGVGNHLVVKVSQTVIVTPSEGDDAPTQGVIAPYQAGHDIPGVDAKVNRYIGLYEVTAQGKVVKFTLIVLSEKDVTPTPQLTPVPGFTPTPDPEPGTGPDTTGIPGVTTGEGNHLVVKVSPVVIDTPNEGDVAPTTGVIDPYQAGDDIPGVDAKVNRYIGLYEVNAQGKVVKFRLIVLNNGDVNPGSPAPTPPVPGFTPTPDPKPGTKPGTTDIPGVTPGAGNHLVVQVSQKVIETPNMGDNAPTTGVINPYQAGDDIPGVDAKVNRYIGLYEVDAQGKVVKFTLIILNENDVTPTPHPVPVPGVTPTPDPKPGTKPGTTVIPGVQPGGDNHLVVKVSSVIIDTPSEGDDAPTTGVINPYQAGDDIPGADTKVNRYIGLYEVNAQGKVVKFSLIVLNDGDVNDPKSVPGFTPTPKPQPGTNPGTTGIPGVTPGEGNHLVVKVSQSVIDTPNEGDDAPTTGVINSYQEGDDIPGVDARVNRYIGLYEVNAQGKVVKFRLIVLSEKDVTPTPKPVPGFTPKPKPQPGSEPGTTGIPGVTPGEGNHLVIKVSSSIIATPSIGDDAPSGTGIINPYQGDDIPGVDAKVNRYVGVYEVDSQGKVVKFRLIVLNDKDVNPGSPAPHPGTKPGTTGIPGAPNGENNHFIIKVSSSVIATPSIGDSAPTTGVIDPYTPGSDIPGVDAKVNRFIGLYEVDAQGKIVSFRLIVLNDKDVNPMPKPTPAPDFTPKPVTVPGTKPCTTDIVNLTPGANNHLRVKVSSRIIETPNAGDDAPTGSDVINPYVKGSDIPGVDARINRYIGVYEVDENGKVVKFRLIMLNQQDISPIPGQLQQDSDQLAIGYQEGDNAERVSKTLYLPGKGPSSKSTVTWISSNEAYIDANGHVTRPDVDAQDVYVTLTAIIRDNETGAVTTKTFVVKVVKLTDEDAVREAAKNLTIDNAFTFAQGDTWESVTLPFLMLAKGLHGTSIAWSSADPSTIDIATQDGSVHATVTRPESKDKHLVLTAKITRGTASITKTFLMVITNKTVAKDANQTRQPTGRTAEATANPDGTLSKVQFTILRTQLSDGTRIDTIIVDPAKMEQLTNNFNPGDSKEANRTVRLNMSQPAQNPADEFAIEIPSSAITAIADRNGLLEIRTDEGSIYLDRAALAKLADQGSDLFFRIVPVRNEAEQSDAADALKSSSLLNQAAKHGGFKRLDIPRKIETNLTGSTTKVVLPLSSAMLRGIDVSTLHVFVEHSDGTTELLAGTIEYENGLPTGIAFDINRFSRFQVVAEELSGGSSSNGKYPAPAFNPSATLDQGSKNGTTKVTTPPPSKGNRIVVQVSDKPVAVPNIGDPAPVGKGVIDPYRLGSDIGGVDPKNNRYIAVYEVDSDNRIVRFQLLVLTEEDMYSSARLIDLYVNEQVQKDTAKLEEHSANGTMTAVITVDNEAIMKQVSVSPTGSVLKVPQVTDSKYVQVVMNGELLKSMIQQAGVFRIESKLAIYTVPAAAIDSKKLFAKLGNPTDLSSVQVTFTIALADPAVETKMKTLAGTNKAVMKVSPVQFSISAELNGKKAVVDQFNSYVQRAIRIADDAQMSSITTGVSLASNGALLHMPTRIEIRDGERFAIISSLYNGPFALISKELSFGDVQGHWAAATVHDLAARTIIKGTSVGKFEPNRSITRAEFVAILVQALGLKRGANAEHRFSDVKQTDWYAEYVAVAAEFKLVNGYTTGEFKPMNAITREEAMAIIANAMKLVGLAKEVQPGTMKATLSAYTDSSQASKWAQNSIAQLIQSGIVRGRTADKIEPKAKITRAEVATIVLKLLRASSLINGTSSGK
ncbi:hypothetical protein Back11_38580 [Paenibacillus baekrokdamisoli]|uniref:Uncharacterized protein n=1 Tax=Paenibacillus baekrokdamisoli TaxID=1712516 RepID=A0A3G9JC43_9BACL|nr:InlB B-repeat-containing protein [Paenibacillus baekrokdamisoli]MBB3068442.1 putative repeat protein (TIGR02543 family) [Paenibacillus baekrokdamisoli]BBH22513.1 hypothetical protein Back11_38580 [Paenibacillus baekrokdamisoli]